MKVFLNLFVLQIGSLKYLWRQQIMELVAFGPLQFGQIEHYSRPSSSRTVTWCLELLEPQHRISRVVLSATLAFETFPFHKTDIAAKNDEKLGTHIIIQGVYMLYRKAAYPWVELKRALAVLGSTGASQPFCCARLTNPVIERSGAKMYYNTYVLKT